MGKFSKWKKKQAWSLDTTSPARFFGHLLRCRGVFASESGPAEGNLSSEPKRPRCKACWCSGWARLAAIANLQNRKGLASKRERGVSGDLLHSGRHPCGCCSLFLMLPPLLFLELFGAIFPSSQPCLLPVRCCASIFGTEVCVCLEEEQVVHSLGGEGGCAGAVIGVRRCLRHASARPGRD